MNKTLRITLIVVVVLIGAVALLWTGAVFGRNYWGMMGGYGSGYGSMGPGMMDNWGYNQSGDNSRYGYDMMGPSMMDGYGFRNSVNAEPLSVEETRIAVESYLASFGDDDLVIEEIMIFDNNAYAIVVEESTGIGAFELLVDPVTKAVYPEYGPNMMWNLKYGMKSSFGGYGMMGPGMMMGGSRFSPGDMMDGFGNGDNSEFSEVTEELSVSPQEALESAQRYLDQYSPGVEVSDEITAFYGYYTIDLEKDSEVVGMLSVNGFTRQVFPHTWHGDFIEMSEVH